ncbi:MAG: hypothetical protein WBX15_01505 [Thermoanaerobaculia bacterium]
MGSARPSVTKRQREQLKRDRKLRKEEKRAQRKSGVPVEDASDDFQSIPSADETPSVPTDDIPSGTEA